MEMESKIIINELKVECIIGDLDFERKSKQAVLIDIEFWYDFSKIAKSDNLKDGVDYFSSAEEVKRFVEQSKFFMIETLAENIADLILKKPEAKKVLVRVKKFSAVKDTKFVAAEIVREKRQV